MDNVRKDEFHQSMARQYLIEVGREFGAMKALAEKAMVQLSDEQFFALIDPESNSVALIVKHMAGNMRSRWTDFLTSDGEKPWRNRDSEFVLTPSDSRESLVESWESGWTLVLETVGSLKPDDLDRTILIRSEPHTVLRAINRQLTHYSHHVGQITFLSKHLCEAAWKTLSIPKGGSQGFNERMNRR